MKKTMIIASQLYPLPNRALIRVTRKVLDKKKLITRDYLYKDIYRGIDKHFQLEELLFENIYKYYKLIYPEEVKNNEIL
jgi:hypothetical protein